MENKQQHIIKTAFQLFLRYGIKSVSVDEIASQCGISKKTLYELIGNKKALVEQVVTQRIKQNQQTAWSFFAGDKLSAIENMINMYQQGYSFFQNFNTSMRYDLEKFDNVLFEKLRVANVKIFHTALVKNYKKGRQEHLYRDGFDVNLTAYIHLMTIRVLMDKVHDSNMNDYSFLEAYREYFKLNMYAILSEKGKQEFERLFEAIDNKRI